MRRRLALALAVAAALLAVAPAARAATASSPIPMLAYYYIWFNPSSWDRAKRDYPLLGRYSSDEQRVMQTHIRWAKAAGIQGFLVSWKDTPVLDRRLTKLVSAANAEHFKLGIVYQGLDFYRRPRPVGAIASDLDYFARRFAHAPAFRLYPKPLVIWSGTWEYSPAQVASVTRGRRDKLMLLASERNAQDYSKLAGSVDGDAYYWSSVNPQTYPSYPQKLHELGDAVHAHRGLWIPPVAPGFDARMIGGTKTVTRQNGTTLRRELAAASRSNPDAFGLISWNEFSENSHVEPSRRYGRRALQVLAEARHASVPAAPEVDSSDPGPADAASGVPVAAGVGGFLAIGLALIAWRTRRRLERLP